MSAGSVVDLEIARLLASRHGSEPFRLVVVATVGGYEGRERRDEMGQVVAGRFVGAVGYEVV